MSSLGHVDVGKSRYKYIYILESFSELADAFETNCEKKHKVLDLCVTEIGCRSQILQQQRQQKLAASRHAYASRLGHCFFLLNLRVTKKTRDRVWLGGLFVLSSKLGR